MFATMLLDMEKFHLNFMVKKNTKTKNKIRLRIDGKPRKYRGGRNPKITEEDVRNLEMCFENDYNVIQACDEAKINTRTFYDRMKADESFRLKMQAAKKRAFAPIKKNVIQKAKIDPFLGIKILERREKKDWSTAISHDMKMAPVNVIFQGGPTQFFDKKEIQRQKDNEEQQIPTDADYFE